ncbi:MAG: stage II sporulation protein M [Bacteroidota bacterium]
MVRYLNGLAARTHLAIYKNKKQRSRRLLAFWQYELPLITYRNHRYLLYSFLIFTFFFMLGVVTTLQNQEFVRMVLGDGYVNLTIQNIERGDPMGIYKDEAPLPMFIRIAYKNIQVAFRAFVFGIFLSAGTIWVLFRNGIMVGAFLTLFQIHHRLAEALPVVYIHGTLELSAIVIAGGAGLMLGHSILFPGTLPRMTSITRATKDGIKVMVGLIPVFIAAAFLEGFVTRLTEWPLWAKLIIILVSLAYVLWYYVVYPRLLHRRLLNQSEEEILALVQGRDTRHFISQHSL